MRAAWRDWSGCTWSRKMASGLRAITSSMETKSVASSAWNSWFMTVASNSTTCPPNDARTVVIEIHRMRTTSGASHPAPSRWDLTACLVCAPDRAGSRIGTSVATAMSRARAMDDRRRLMRSPPRSAVSRFEDPPHGRPRLPAGMAQEEADHQAGAEDGEHEQGDETVDEDRPVDEREVEAARPGHDS